MMIVQVGTLSVLVFEKLETLISLSEIKKYVKVKLAWNIWNRFPTWFNFVYTYRIVLSIEKLGKFETRKPSFRDQRVISLLKEN